MRLRVLKTAAMTAAAGGTAVLCLGGAQGAQGAQAAPRPGVMTVPCSANALSAAVAGAISGTTLSLASGCTYALTAPLVVTGDITIDGHGATAERSYASGTPDSPSSLSAAKAT